MRNQPESPAFEITLVLSLGRWILDSKADQGLLDYLHKRFPLDAEQADRRVCLCRIGWAVALKRGQGHHPIE